MIEYTSDYFNSYDDEDSSLHARDFTLFLSDIYKKKFKNAENQFEVSEEIIQKKKKYINSSRNDKLKHADISTMVKALIGAVFNCEGFVVASKFVKHLGIIKEEWKMVEPMTEKDYPKHYTKIIKRFDATDLPADINPEDLNNFIANKTGYKFKNVKILATALTHKSQSRHKNGNIWDDYNLLEFLGDSVIKFFNCKRIIRMKEDLLKTKEDKFTDIQRIKFIRTAAEKNLLFSFICVDSGIHRYIRHDTSNRDTIEMYEEYVNAERGYIELDDLDQFHVKMLADVIESIIGAILLDSYDIRVTEKAWL